MGSPITKGEKDFPFILSTNLTSITSMLSSEIIIFPDSIFVFRIIRASFIVLVFSNALQASFN